MYPVPDPDPYYLSKIRINLRKKFNILSYLMINYLFDNIFFINVRNNVQICDSGLRIHRSGSERNIYGFTTLHVRIGSVLYDKMHEYCTAAAKAAACRTLVRQVGSVCRTTGSINKDDPT
jgi:hypothetical protein